MDATEQCERMLLGHVVGSEQRNVTYALITEVVLKEESRHLPSLLPEDMEKLIPVYRAGIRLLRRYNLNPDPEFESYMREKQALVCLHDAISDSVPDDWGNRDITILPDGLRDAISFSNGTVSAAIELSTSQVSPLEALEKCAILYHHSEHGPLLLSGDAAMWLFELAERKIPNYSAR